MALTTLLYVSTSCIDPRDAEAALAAIVGQCTQHNSARGLTGALLFTGTHFAQVLEGQDDAIESLIQSITRDVRHTDVLVVDRGPLAARRFPEWSMAYFGPSQFVARHVVRLLNHPPQAERRRAAEWLTQLLTEFASA